MLCLPLAVNCAYCFSDLDTSRYKADTSIKPLVRLEIKNCEFKYFLKDYEALIYAETSIVERKLT